MSEAVKDAAGPLTMGGVIDEQQSEKRDDARLANDLAAIFNAFDRVITMMRVYPRGHPILDELAENLAGRMKRLFEDHHDGIVVRVGAQQLGTIAGTEFFSRETAEKGQYIWYNAYADGLIALEFEVGITAEELLDFLAVIDISAQGAITSDDDTVTLLWERDLTHITYTAVEGFVDSGGVETFDELPEPEAVQLVADSLETPGSEASAKLQQMFNNLNLQHVDLFTKMEIQAQAKMMITELRDADLAYAFGVEEGLIDKLNVEWTSGVDLEYRLIEALLSIVRTSPGSSAGERAAELIEAVTKQLLSSQMFLEAARVLELLHDRRDVFRGAEYDPLGELIEELSDPLQLEALLHTMQKSTKNREAIATLLPLLGPNKVQLQILRLFADKKRKIVAKAQLFEVMMAATSPENEHQLVEKDFLESEVYLKRLLSEFDEEDARKFSAMPRLIRAALQSADNEVIAFALAIDNPVWADNSVGERHLVPLSTSDSEEVRNHALEKLGHYHPDLFREAIRDTILAAELKDRSFAELRFLMRVFIESDPKAPEMLRNLLNTRGWFSASKREFAKMAAAVLLENGDAAAREKVEAFSSSFWTHPDLKRSYSATLKRFGATRALPAPAETVEEEPTEQSAEEEARDGE